MADSSRALLLSKRWSLWEEQVKEARRTMDGNWEAGGSETEQKERESVESM